MNPAPPVTRMVSSSCSLASHLLAMRVPSRECSVGLRDARGHRLRPMVTACQFSGRKDCERNTRPNPWRTRSLLLLCACCDERVVGCVGVCKPVNARQRDLSSGSSAKKYAEFRRLFLTEDKLSGRVFPVRDNVPQLFLLVSLVRPKAASPAAFGRIRARTGKPSDIPRLAAFLLPVRAFPNGLRFARADWPVLSCAPCA